ncbi:MAG: sodium:solute symporter [bacterium]
MPQFELSTIDLTIVIAYLVFIVVLGLRFTKKNESAEDYFLGGRVFTWPLIGLSLYASNMSSASLIGMAGSAYATGISVYNYEWMAAVVLVFFAIFFLPYYLKSQVYTMPEFLERRYDSRARYIFSSVTLIGTIIIDTAGSLYAGALVVKLIFPQIPMWQSITTIALFSGLYTIAGGLAAVVYTDSIQAILLTIGAIMISVIAFMKVGSWEAVTAVTPPEMLSVIQPLSDSFLPWLGLLTGVPLLGFYFWCNNQFMVQRVLGAKDVNHGRWGALFAGLLKLPIIFIMVLPGTMARVLYPAAENPAIQNNPDLVFPTLMFDLLPVGVLGIVAAGLIAAIMSSIDSTLNSASTLVTMDFFKKLRPRTTSSQLTWAGRIFTGIFMILAAAWAPNIEKFPSLWQYLQTVLGYIAPPIVACFLMGLFWKRANAHGAFAALIVGFAVGILDVGLRVAGVSVWFVEIHFLYLATLRLIICLATLYIVSLLTAPPAEEKVKAYIWTKEVFRSETQELSHVPWFKNYRVQSLILLALTAIFVSVFW